MRVSLCKIKVHCCLFGAIAITVCLTGCLTPRKTQMLFFLKRFGENRAAIEEYLSAQEKGFQLLKRDIESGNLLTGISRQSVIDRYSEPIFCKETEGADRSSVCLFRHPTRYFSTERAHLYFDKDGYLRNWQFISPP